MMRILFCEKRRWYKIKKAVFKDNLLLFYLDLIGGVQSPLCNHRAKVILCDYILKHFEKFVLRPPLLLPPMRYITVMPENVYQSLYFAEPRCVPSVG